MKYLSLSAGALIIGALLLLAACESAPSSSSGEADSSGVAAPAADTSRRATARADSLAERLIARTDSIFGTVQGLSAREKRRLRHYLQDEHLARARRFGVGPVQDRRAAARLMKQNDDAVRVQTGDSYIIDPRMSYAVPLLVPSAAHLLDRIGQRFQEDLITEGLPPYRFIITNVLRTGLDQTHLRGRNANAAQGQSTHEYGTTFDIFYGRFHYAPARDALARSAPRPRDFNEAHLRQRLRRAYLHFGETHASKIKAMLGRTLIRMQEDGLLLAIYERDQDVFHITMAREMEAPATPAPSTASPMSAAMRRFYANTESLLSDIDNDITEIEQQAGEQSNLAELRDERDRMRQALTRLDAMSTSSFQRKQADLRQRRARLEGRVERARIEATPNARELRGHLRTLTQEMGRAISQLEELAGSANQQRVADLRKRLGKLERLRPRLRGASGRSFREKRSEIAGDAARLKTDLEEVAHDVNAEQES